MPVDNKVPVIKDIKDKQRIVGPDGKGYWFKKTTSKDQQDAWFKKNNITAPTTGGSPGNQDMMHEFATGTGFGTAVAEYGSASLPTAGGFAGAAIAGGKGPTAAAGAGIGGAVGETIRDLVMRHINTARGMGNPSTFQSIKNVGKEAATQAVLQFGGEKAGEYFFKMLDKVIPHSVTKGGIPLLPGDLNPNGKVMRYIEDLLTNLSPSGGTMEKYFDKQSAAAEKKAQILAKGFSKFSGTSEELGNLIQNTVRKEGGLEYERVAKLKKSGASKAILQQAKDDYDKVFRNDLSKAIASTQNPELIVGDLRSATKASLENTRTVMDLLYEKNPKLVGDVQNRLMRDIIQETMTGVPNPTVRQVTGNRFSGKDFISTLNNIGEDKLKAIYGETKYANIQKFEKLTQSIDRTHGNGVGRFWNLMFLLPLRQGLGLKGTGKILFTALVANRAAQVITSPEGIKIYEDFIKASSSNLPRLTKLAIDEMKTYAQRQDEEYIMEKKQAQDEFDKNMQKENGGNKK